MDVGHDGQLLQMVPGSSPRHATWGKEGQQMLSKERDLQELLKDRHRRPCSGAFGTAGHSTSVEQHAKSLDGRVENKMESKKHAATQLQIIHMIKDVTDG